MRLNELKDNAGATHRKKRIGRGIGSGKGKTGGRGVKGQKSRSGVAINGFEGGQMPIYMRLPKRGFNKPNRKRFQELSIASLNRAIAAGKLDAKTDYDAAALVEAGVIRRAKDGVRLIGSGKVEGVVKLHVSGATANAKAAVEKAKGTVNVLDEDTVYRAKGEKQDRTNKKTKAEKKGAPKAEKPKPAPKPKPKPKPAPKPKAEAKPAPKAEPKPKAKEPQVLYTDGATDGEPDDLKKIKGIGPKFEGDLNAKGVYYYRQIAAWTKKDIKMIDEIIDSFPGRIERDEWVKQAKTLAKG
jgi:large subunit ribosomal protein L15